MKLKLDENGHVVVQDGMPVYVDDDGKEIPFDAAGAMSKITALNNEAKNHRLAKEAAEKALKEFEGFDINEAKKAMETVKALDTGQLKSAEAVEKLKKDIAASFEVDKQALISENEKRHREFEEKLGEKETTIRNLMLRSKFESSPHFAGDKPKTTLLPEVAAEYFGRYFTIEGDYPDIRVIGKNPQNGEVILSRTRYGEPASFEEAISFMIEQHPGKDRLLAATKGGPGAFRGQGSDGKTINWNDDAAFSEHLEQIAKGEISVQR